MKKKFIQVKNYPKAKEQAPWTTVISKVKGGYMAFESYTDYNIWKKQKAD